MFKKPFRVKSQSVMKGSDRKKLRAEIQKSFSTLTVSDINNIIPSKDEVTTVKVYSNAGDNLFIYCVNKQPVLFEVDKEKVLYPTVYLLWQYPDMVEQFTTWPPVFKKLVEGADLMLPGLVLRQPLSPATFKHVQKGQVCSVNVVGNRSSVAVGYTLMSGTDFFDSGMKGKGIHPLHLLGDELWSFGDKSSPPELESDPIPLELDDDDAEDCNISAESLVKDAESEGGANMAGVSGGEVDPAEGQGPAEDDDDDDGGAAEQDQDVRSGTEEGATALVGHGSGDNEVAAEGGSFSLEELSIEDKEKDTAMTADQMDELLLFCFLCAIKSSVKKSDLPLPTGTFYKSHMMKYCAKEKRLDIKKSSFKKLSKFLQKQEQTGIIRVKEMSKGVDSIVELDKSHELLRGFAVPEVEEEKVVTTSVEYIPPQITEMFAITANVLPLFCHKGYSKGTPLTSSDVRRDITEYVKIKELQSQDSKSEVVLDPCLADILTTKHDVDRTSLKWEELFSRLLNKMSPVYQVALNGQPPIIKKGNLEPVKIDVCQRASNKKVTVVENLEVYGIDLKDFCHRVQVKVACSATVKDSQAKNQGPHVVVQGNQITCVTEILSNVYKIPKKHVKTLEKAPKSRK